jgi:hypothetical protein
MASASSAQQPSVMLFCDRFSSRRQRAAGSASATASAPRLPSAFQPSERSLRLLERRSALARASALRVCYSVVGVTHLARASAPCAPMLFQSSRRHSSWAPASRSATWLAPPLVCVGRGATWLAPPLVCVGRGATWLAPPLVCVGRDEVPPGMPRRRPVGCSPGPARSGCGCRAARWRRARHRPGCRAAQRKQRAVAARPKRLPLRSARALEKRRLRMCTRAAELVQAQRRLMARAAAHGLRLQAHLYSVVGVCYSVVRVTHLEGVCCSAVGVPLTACASF